MERKFHEDLDTLKGDLLGMGGLAETMVDTAVRALARREPALLSEVKQQEEEINAMHLALDERCFTLMALYQPTAGDLRLLIAAVKIISDLERIGDQAINIVESSEELLKEPPVKPLIDIPRMAKLAHGMVHNSLKAFVQADIALARTVLVSDDEVDNLRDQIARELVTFMIGDPKTISGALQLILIARYLERIADHATNIAEDVIFMALGADVRHHALDQELSTTTSPEQQDSK